MSAFPALVRREWRAYWRTPLALVYVVIFLLLSNSFVFYLGDLFEAGQAGMQSYFRLLPWVCLLLVPVCVLLWLIRGIFAAVDWCSLRLKSA